MAEYKDEYKAGGTGIIDLYNAIKELKIPQFQSKIPIGSISKIEVKITYTEPEVV